jgi:uncharacterized protein (TIGR03437 family)
MAHCQAPAIQPGGVVSGATFSTGGQAGNGVAPGSLATVFGANFATDIFVPDPLQFPTEVNGTSVIVGGVPAYLIYVSPDQINFQMPNTVSGPTAVIVSTPSGSSSPYPIDAADAFGVFTHEMTGCGAAAALNPASVNSATESASPGDYVAIFGTGLFPLDPTPPDGVPAPSLPLSSYSGSIGQTVFDVDGPSSPNMWVGIAPGLVGVNQINVTVPSDAREGCAVPLLISTGANGNTSPVTISINRGGGPCSDPPEEGYGQLQWVKTVIQGVGSASETNAVTISLQASPGKQSPPAPSFARSATAIGVVQNFGPQCPVPGYRSLDAGAIAVQGPGFGPTPTVLSGLGPPDSGQVAGLTEYIANLATGTIQTGTFRVTASGGADVAAFQSDLQIGAGIGITTTLIPGAVLNREAALTVNWTGGDSNSWVTMKMVFHYGTYDQSFIKQAPASDGTITMTLDDLAAMPAGPLDIDLEVDPGSVTPLLGTGLSLGGQHSWKYVYEFLGLVLK